MSSDNKEMDTSEELVAIEDVSQEDEISRDNNEKDTLERLVAIDLDELNDLGAPIRHENRKTEIITITEDLDANDTLAVDDSDSDKESTGSVVDISDGCEDVELISQRKINSKRKSKKLSETIDISDDDNDDDDEDAAGSSDKTNRKKQKLNVGDNEEDLLHTLINDFDDELNSSMI